MASRDGLLSLTLVGLAAVACGSTKTAVPPFSIDPVDCPAGQESSDGKIPHESYLRAHPDLTHSIVVRLRTVAGIDAGRPELDAALIARQALNQKQVDCVFGAFGPPGSLKGPLAQWYEAPLSLAAGRPVPIGTAFSALALWSQIESVARHPYVEKVEPAIGEAAKIGVRAPEVRPECPTADEAATPKVADAAAIQGQGRQPVVIELRQELLPPLQVVRAKRPATSS